MKKLFCLLTGILLSSICPAQSLSPTSLASSGGSASLPAGYLDWTLGEVATATFDMPQNFLTQGFQQPFGGYRVSGTMRYLNAAQTPLSNCTAYLQTFAGQTLDSALTGATGKFYFFHAGNGTYKTKGKSTKTWGGANATDALLILKHFVGIAQLQGMYKKAGDVDNSSAINSLDALIVARRFTGIIASFAAGDWRFSVDTAIVGLAPDQQDMSVLCNGDVNGSYTPAAKIMPNVALLTEGELDCADDMEIILPIRAMQDFRTAAVSLVLELQADWFRVKDVVFANDDGNLVWNQQDNELRIAWYATSGAGFKTGDLVLSLQIETKDMAGADPLDLLPGIGDGSEIAGIDGELLPPLKLSIPRLRNIQAVSVTFFNCCDPNPASDHVSISYGLEVPAQVSIALYDLPGQLIRKTDLDLVQAGTYSYVLDYSIYPPGIYLVRFNSSVDGRAVSITRKLVLSH
jgi:hypothetical protein